MRRLPVALMALATVALANAADPTPAPTELRTLFHSAAEREKLDRARRGEPPAESPAEAARRDPPKVTGFVRRSDGRDPVWLDGRPVTGAEAKRLAEAAKAREGADASRGIEIKRSR